MPNFKGGKLTNNERVDGLTHVFRVTYTDLIAIGTGVNETLFTLPEGAAVTWCGVYEAVPLVGSSSSVLDIGTTSGDPDEFIDALDVDAMTAAVYNTGDAFTGAQCQPLGMHNTAAGVAVYMQCTDAAMASLTAGELVIGFNVIDLGRFDSARNV